MIPVAITCIVVFPPWDGILAWLQPLPRTVQEQVDDAVGHGLAGIIVYVDVAGQPPAFYAAGWKDRDQRLPADPHALFKIASISKMYIAVAAAKLVGEHRLSLDDTLADHFPDLVGGIANAERITVRMMLQHRSGIPNYTDQDGFNWFEQKAAGGRKLARVLGQPADFEPGTSYRYSNTNYLLVGDILDQVLGYSHQRYIKEKVLTPLGLTHTYGQLGEVDSDDVASGYHHKVDADLKGLNFTSPGGSMIATAQDVGIFLRALNDGSLLNEDEQAIYSSIYEFGHKGWLPGYQSIARYHQDIDAVVVQFVSTTGGNSELTAMVVYNRIVRILQKEMAKRG